MSGSVVSFPLTSWSADGDPTARLTAPPNGGFTSNNTADGSNVALFLESADASLGIYQDIDGNFTVGLGYELRAAMARSPSITYLSQTTLELRDASSDLLLGALTVREQDLPANGDMQYFSLFLDISVTTPDVIVGKPIRVAVSATGSGPSFSFDDVRNHSAAVMAWPVC